MNKTQNQMNNMKPEKKDVVDKIEAIKPQEDYYTKARTEKGWLFFKTKDDFNKWRNMI